MDCQIIFYMAQKTGYCEKTLKRKFKNTKFSITAASGAATVKELGVCLASAVNSYNFIIILGGLSKKGNNNITHVLSRAFSQTTANLQIKKVINPKGGDDGYILESGEQIILVLPDVPEDIFAMTGNSLLKYLSSFFKLPYEPVRGEPDIDVLLDDNSHGAGAENTNVGNNTAMPSGTLPDSYFDEYNGEEDGGKRSKKWLYVFAVVAAVITIGVIICDVMIVKRFW